jgi:hypothetical protein
MVALLRRCSLPPAATLLWTSGRADSLRCRRSIRTDKTVGVARGYPGGPLTTNGLVHSQGFVSYKKLSQRFEALTGLDLQGCSWVLEPRWPCNPLRPADGFRSVTSCFPESHWIGGMQRGSE